MATSSTVTSVNLTPDAALLLALHAAMAQGGDAGFSRQTWAMQILIEQAVAATDPHSSICMALTRGLVERRGVTSASVDRAVDHLTITGCLVPTGVGSNARWQLNPVRSVELTRLRHHLSAADLKALDVAAQRTLAVMEAWSKRSRNCLPDRSAMSTVSPRRRQPDEPLTKIAAE